MICFTQCGLATILIFSKLFTLFTCNKSEAYLHLRNILNDQQKQILDKVTKERLHIYLRGQLLGIIIGGILLYHGYLHRNDATSITKFFNLCGFILVINLVVYLNYHFTPKSDYLLLHLNNKEQNKAWVNMYEHMKQCHIKSFLYGFLAYSILGYVAIYKFINNNKK